MILDMSVVEGRVVLTEQADLNVLKSAVLVQPPEVKGEIPAKYV